MRSKILSISLTNSLGGIYPITGKETKVKFSSCQEVNNQEAHVNVCMQTLNGLVQR